MTPYVSSKSSSPLWYAVRRASAHIIVLSSYSPFGMSNLFLFTCIVYCQGKNLQFLNFVDKINGRSEIINPLPGMRSHVHVINNNFRVICLCGCINHSYSLAQFMMAINFLLHNIITGSSLHRLSTCFDISTSLLYLYFSLIFVFKFGY